MTAKPGGKSGGRRGSELVRLDRAMTVARLLGKGASRRQVLEHAAREWNMPPRTVDRLIHQAREELVRDFSVDRKMILAQILSQLSVLHMRAIHENQLAVALGCINATAKLARLFDPVPPQPVRFTSVNINPPPSPPPSGRWVQTLPHRDD